MKYLPLLPYKESPYEIDAALSEDGKILERHLEGLIMHYYKPISRQWTNPTIRFFNLKEEWETETAALSSVTDIAMHSTYQQIIGMGPIALPFILHDMMIKPGHWFWALKSITGEDPVSPEQRGRIKEMTEAWLRWGREQRYL